MSERDLRYRLLLERDLHGSDFVVSDGSVSVVAHHADVQTSEPARLLPWQRRGKAGGRKGSVP